jgi:hypothetical protein
MPRIDQIQSQSRLQVSSPVAIRSSASARVEGEAIEDFGSKLTRAGMVVGEFARQSAQAEAAAQNETLRATATRASQEAFYESQTKYQKQDGSDQLATYDAAYKERMDAVLSALPEGQQRQRAAQIFQIEGTKAVDNVVRSSIETKVNSIKTTRTEALGITLGNVSANPYAALEQINQNRNSLEQSSVAYSPAELQAARIDESRTIAQTAVRGLLGNDKLGSKRFDDARKMIQGDLAPYLGKDVPTLLEVVSREQEQWTNTTLRNRAQADQQLDEVRKEEQRTNVQKLYALAAGNPTPEQQTEIRETAYTLVAQGKLTTEQAELIERKTPYVMNSSGPTRASYMEQITSGSFGPDINERLLRESASGTLTQKDALDLMKIASAKSNAPRNNDPTYSKQLSAGEERIKQANGGYIDNFGIPRVPKDRQTNNTQMMADYYEHIGQGKTPTEATKLTLDSYYGDIAQTKYLPGNVVPVHLQSDLKGMRESENLLRAEVSRLKTDGSEASLRRATAIMKLYKDRLQALSHVEAQKGTK